MKHHRWLQFRLRALLIVVAAVAVLMAVVVHHLDWLQQRRELLTHGNMAVGDGPNYEEIYEPATPGLLKLFSENAYGYIIVFPERQGGPLTAAEREKVQRVTRLFPEARVDAQWPE